MFLHEFKYAFMSLMRTRELVFWTLLFPFALGTFMFLAFGNLTETTEKFHVIPTAVVWEKEDEIYTPAIEALSKEGDDQLIQVTDATSSEADKLLSDDKVKGIICVGDSLTLKVKENGLEQTILKMILNQMKRYRKLVTDVGVRYPANVNQAAARLEDEVNCLVEKKMSDGNTDSMTNFFYAIFAMTCLFASFAGGTRARRMQADTSDLGQRRGVSPTHKFVTFLAEFAACELVQFVIAWLVFLYMRFALGIQLGEHYAAIALLLFAGTCCGNMFGFLVGSLPKLGEGAKTGIMISVSMVLCVLSDLVAGGVYALVEENIPILNRVNPAALIANSFYALNVYGTWQRYAQNVISLGAITLVMAFAGFMLIRRQRYASL